MLVELMVVMVIVGNDGYSDDDCGYVVILLHRLVLL